MGSPGYWVLCENGHEIGKIDEHVYWDKSLWKKLGELEQSECKICGSKITYSFSHYGDINDCQLEKLIWNNEEKRWIIPKNVCCYKN